MPYHLGIPKYRKKRLFGQLRKYLGQVFRDLARSRESEVIEGHLSEIRGHPLQIVHYLLMEGQMGGYG
jgi:putative transposase